MTSPAFYPIRIEIFKEGDAFVAYVPSLDLSTAGSSMTEAKRMCFEAIEIFLEELKNRLY